MKKLALILAILLASCTAEDDYEQIPARYDVTVYQKIEISTISNNGMLRWDKGTETKLVLQEENVSFKRLQEIIKKYPEGVVTEDRPLDDQPNFFKRTIITTTHDVKTR